MFDQKTLFVSIVHSFDLRDQIGWNFFGDNRIDNDQRITKKEMSLEDKKSNQLWNYRNQSNLLQRQRTMNRQMDEALKHSPLFLFTSQRIGDECGMSIEMELLPSRMKRSDECIGGNISINSFDGSRLNCSRIVTICFRVKGRPFDARSIVMTKKDVC